MANASTEMMGSTRKRGFLADVSDCQARPKAQTCTPQFNGPGHPPVSTRELGCLLSLLGASVIQEEEEKANELHGLVQSLINSLSSATSKIQNQQCNKCSRSTLRSVRRPSRLELQQSSLQRGLSQQQQSFQEAPMVKRGSSSAHYARRPSHSRSCRHSSSSSSGSRSSSSSSSGTSSSRATSDCTHVTEEDLPGPRLPPIPQRRRPTRHVYRDNGIEILWLSPTSSRSRLRKKNKEKQQKNGRESKDKSKRGVAADTVYTLGENIVESNSSNPSTVSTSGKYAAEHKISAADTACPRRTSKAESKTSDAASGSATSESKTQNESVVAVAGPAPPQVRVGGADADPCTAAAASAPTRVASQTEMEVLHKAEEVLNRGKRDNSSVPLLKDIFLCLCSALEKTHEEQQKLVRRQRRMERWLVQQQREAAAVEQQAVAATAAAAKAEQANAAAAAEWTNRFGPSLLGLRECSNVVNSAALAAGAAALPRTTELPPIPPHPWSVTGHPHAAAAAVAVATGNPCLETFWWRGWAGQGPKLKAAPPNLKLHHQPQQQLRAAADYNPAAPSWGVVQHERLLSLPPLPPVKREDVEKVMRRATQNKKKSAAHGDGGRLVLLTPQ